MSKVTSHRLGNWTLEYPKLIWRIIWVIENSWNFQSYDWSWRCILFDHLKRDFSCHNFFHLLFVTFRTVQKRRCRIADWRNMPRLCAALTAHPSHIKKGGLECVKRLLNWLLSLTTKWSDNMEFCSLSTSSMKDRNILHMTTSIYREYLKVGTYHYSLVRHDIKCY